MPTTYPRAASALLAAVLMLAAGGPAALAQKAEVFQSGREQFGANLAVGGFDTVAYHTQKQALAGNPAFRVSWKGAEWRFSTAENRDQFVKEPEKFAPQFGGYCAFAVAFGSTAAGDPRYFTLVNGKLYLNLNESVHATWQRDQANLIRRGEQNWPKVLQ